MKKILITSAIISIAVIVYSQAPNAFNYQAILRNSDGTVKANETVSIQISIATEGGASAYLEIHNTQTNEFGLVNLVIGQGTTTDDLSTVDWSNGPYYIDITVSGVTLGSSPLLSVPYALHTKTADSLSGGIVEFDPVYSASSAAAIISTDIERWNNKLDEYLETDPVFDASVAAKIEENDLYSWNNKLDEYTEIQNLSEVLTLGNDGGGYQIKNIANPTDYKDVVTMSSVTLRVSLEGDTLFMGSNQWIIVPGISQANYESNTVLDGDGNRYSVVKIGTQSWIASNLQTIKLNDGTIINQVTHSATWEGAKSPSYCWYDNEELNKDSYGALYNWSVIETGKLCPAGWHVSTNADWINLAEFLGGEELAAGQLKTTGTTYWLSPNTGATNETLFSALPGGYRSGHGSFTGEYSQGYWWTSTENNSIMVNFRMMHNNSTMLSNYSYDKRCGMSVRCVKD